MQRRVLRPSGGDANAYLKAGDLLSEDGRYSVRRLCSKVISFTPGLQPGGRFSYFGEPF